MPAFRRVLTVVVVLSVVAVGCSASDSDGKPATGDTANTIATSDGGAGSVGTGQGCSAEVSENDETATIENVIAASVAEYDLRGIVYAVSRDGELIAAGAAGESLPGEAASEAMHFRIGNVAFAYLGTLLLLMVESGEVSLDTTVAELLPGLDVPNAERITLEMLIRNTSGLPDHVRIDEFVEAFEADPFRSYTVEELLSFSETVPPWYEPGTGWSYSHTGHVILGEALAAAADQPLEELLAERVIEPAGLENTTATLQVAMPDPVLHSFTTERDVWEESTNFNPSWQTAPGSVVTSTVCDLVLSAEQIGSGQLLNEESYETLTSPPDAGLAPQPEDCPPEVCRQQSDDTYYAFGVRVSNGWVAQAPLFGGAGGVHAYLPADDVAIAIQATTGPDTGEIGNPADLIWADLAEVLTPNNPTRAS